MKTKIKNSLIAALAVATIAGASIGIATLSNNQQALSQGSGFMGTYSLTAFADEASATGNTVALSGTSVNVTTTKSVLSDNEEYKLYVTAIDTGDINVSSAEVGYTYNGTDYNGAYEKDKTGLSNVVYSSLSARISETEYETLTVADMFASQIKDFTGDAWLVIAEIPVVADAAEATLTIKEVADFASEFSIDNQDGAWKYGYVNYQWGTNEDFTFIKAENKNSDAWLADGVEIKAGWINANALTTIAYTVNEDTDITAVLKIVGGTENTRLALRVGVKNSDGTIY
ncbi:MAG: hypothetical protein ACI4QI_08870, partial [Candidatus Coproplasma sp.]